MSYYEVIDIIYKIHLSTLTAIKIKMKHKYVTLTAPQQF